MLHFSQPWSTRLANLLCINQLLLQIFCGELTDGWDCLNVDNGKWSEDRIIVPLDSMIVWWWHGVIAPYYQPTMILDCSRFWSSSSFCCSFCRKILLLVVRAVRQNKGQGIDPCQTTPNSTKQHEILTIFSNRSIPPKHRKRRTRLPPPSSTPIENRLWKLVSALDNNLNSSSLGAFWYFWRASLSGGVAAMLLWFVVVLVCCCCGLLLEVEFYQQSLDLRLLKLRCSMKI